MSDDGLEQFLATVDRADERVRDAVRSGVSQFAEVVMARSKELCPVSSTNPTIVSEKTGEKIKNPNYTGTSGALRDSGEVGEVEVNGDEISVPLSYNTDYAAAVHERMDANHKYEGAPNPDAQAFYLFTAIVEFQPRLVPFVGPLVQQAIGGGA